MLILAVEFIWLTDPNVTGVPSHRPGRESSSLPQAVINNVAPIAAKAVEIFILSNLIINVFTAC